MDAAGTLIWRFKGEWTDDQIMAALEFANHAYGLGYSRGWKCALKAVRKAIGIEE